MRTAACVRQPACTVFVVSIGVGGHDLRRGRRHGSEPYSLLGLPTPAGPATASRVRALAFPVNCDKPSDLGLDTEEMKSTAQPSDLIPYLGAR